MVCINSQIHPTKAVSHAEEEEGVRCQTSENPSLSYEDLEPVGKGGEIREGCNLTGGGRNEVLRCT